jgi:hypothetical protein
MAFSGGFICTSLTQKSFSPAFLGSFGFFASFRVETPCLLLACGVYPHFYEECSMVLILWKDNGVKEIHMAFFRLLWNMCKHASLNFKNYIYFPTVQPFITWIASIAYDLFSTIATNSSSLLRSLKWLAASNATL